MKKQKKVRLPARMSLRAKEKLVDRIIDRHRSNLMASISGVRAFIHVPADLSEEVAEILAEAKAEAA